MCQNTEYGAPAGYPIGQYAGASSYVPPGKSTGPLVVTLVLGLALAVSLGVIVVQAMRGPQPAPAQTTTVTATTQVTVTAPPDVTGPAMRMSPFECFFIQDLVDHNYTQAMSFDCHSPHDAEVFYTGSAPGNTYPDDARWQELVAELCHPAFELYVGVPYDKSSFKLGWLSYPRDDWERNGRRTLMCYVSTDTLWNQSVYGTKM